MALSALRVGVAPALAQSPSEDGKIVNAVREDQPAHKLNIFVRKFLLPHSSERPLTRAEIKPFSCFDLWVVRNEIYYRRGYCFQAGRGQDYFGDDDCFLRRIPKLTRIETGNVRLIQSTEKQKSCVRRRSG